LNEYLLQVYPGKVNISRSKKGIEEEEDCQIITENRDGEKIETMRSG
jgi:hypothetical protein